MTQHQPSQAEVLEAIEAVSRALSRLFPFGPYTADDLSQEIAVWCLEALGRYDPQPGPDGRPTRPLANYFYRHAKNRLCNLFRDKYRRNDPPCLVCHHAVGRRTAHPGGEFCKRYLAWAARNEAKASLMRAANGQALTEEAGEADASEQAETAELRALVDEKLAVELRGDYLRMRAGEKLPKGRRREVEEAVRHILGAA
jgi:DNA-directed RNA polymerase specialized sigma24 family protein